MQEVAFHKKNREKWKQFEALIAQKNQADPDTLASLFIELTDDLAYARTFYPKSSTAQYLNSLTAKVHQALYRNKREERSRIITFWTQEVPRLSYEVRYEILLTLALVVVFFLFGLVSAANDASYVRLIMGDEYVNMSLENMKNNDPMGVYKKQSGMDMMSYIPVHNIVVSFQAFAYGVVVPPFGSLYFMFVNSIMLAAFMHMFFQHGFGTEAMLGVWVHGTLEISAIILAGAAGVVMGNSILFPGTYTRARSFAHGAKKGMKLVLSLVPILFVAGFLESFVTRHTNMPLALNLAIIVGSLLFIVWYFGIYPIYLHRKGTSGSTTNIPTAPESLI